MTMVVTARTERGTRALAWSLWAFSVVGALVMIGLEVGRGPAPPATVNDAWFNAQAGVGAIAFATVGAVLATRRRENAIGWLFLAIGVSSGLSAIGAALQDTSTFRSDVWQWATWLETWTWVPGWVLILTFVLLLFPDGHLPSPWWRWVAWIAAAGVAGQILGGIISPTGGDTAGYHSPLPTIPAAISDLLLLTGLACIAVAAVASVVGLIVRYRGSRGETREQMRWFVFAGVVTVILVPTRSVWAIGHPLALAIGLASVVVLPVAVGIAVLRYRLYDIDVVINKTIVYGVLASFITVVYVAVVVGFGALLGSGSGTSVPLQVAATAIVAIAFQPIREWARRLANRLVYGERATPYEVMAGLSRRVAGTVSIADVLPEMAETSATGIGATHGQVRLRLRGGDRVVAWPDEPPARAPDVAATVRHQGEDVGEIAAWKAAGDAVTPAERALIDDLAAHSGLAIHNVRLTDELAARAEDLAVQSEQLRRSRERLVTARDVQRRRLEQDIREGPQRQLVSIGATIRDVAGQVEREPEVAATELDALGKRATSTLEGLRDLARGIFPPLLADKGIVAALEAHIRKIGANATIDATADVAGCRFSAEVEIAVYFCCLQAIQNVVRHAGNAAATVALSLDGSALSFDVADRGPGFDVASVPRGMGLQIMEDRVAALGGELEISSDREGTTVSGRVPARVVEEVVS
jgi:signal transduction histidine kinase